ncbi:MAG: hypothetical protein RLZZ69_3559, partial [Cyanobacteriota bacterium]
TLTQYEVNLILKNVLFVPWYKVNYAALPWVVSTQPNLARVGLSEQQAQQQYGEKIYIVKQYFNRVAQAQIFDQTTGICKLLIRENGAIIGCSIIGDRATELIAIVALMIQHKINLNRNPMRGLTSLSLPIIYPSMAEILQLASDNFYWQKLQRHPQLVKRLQTWFSLGKN